MFSAVVHNRPIFIQIYVTNGVYNFLLSWIYCSAFFFVSVLEIVIRWSKKLYILKTLYSTNGITRNDMVFTEKGRLG